MTVQDALDQIEVETDLIEVLRLKAAVFEILFEYIRQMPFDDWREDKINI